jgi:hypothetical protein
MTVLRMSIKPKMARMPPSQEIRDQAQWLRHGGTMIVGQVSPEAYAFCTDCQQDAHVLLLVVNQAEAEVILSHPDPDELDRVAEDRGRPYCQPCMTRITQLWQWDTPTIVM